MKKAVSILVLFLCFMCFPLKAEGKTVEIYTAHDLVKLAKSVTMMRILRICGWS